MQIDEARLGHAEFAGLGQARHQDARRLVHLHDGVQVLGVGKAHHPVALGDGDQLFGRARNGEPGVAIARSDFCERRKKLAQPLLVIGDAPLVPGAQGVLEQGIGVDRPPQAVPRLVRRHAGPRVADPLRRIQALVFVPVVEPQPLGQPLGGGAQELASRHQAKLALALRNPFAKGVDQLLRAVAPHMGIDRPGRRRAERLGEAQGRIGAVRRGAPAAGRIHREPHHGQAVDGGQITLGETRVLRGAKRRNLQQSGRRRRRLRFAAICELTRPDQNWGSIVHLNASAPDCTIRS